MRHIRLILGVYVRFFMRLICKVATIRTKLLIQMRNTFEIPVEEYKERIIKYSSLLNDAYRKALQRSQSEIFSNPDCHEWRNESGQKHMV